ncbi:MAG: hypothetical protein ACOCVF_02160 [bacterium]
MIKTLSSGGLGDATMAFAKMGKLNDDISHTHIELPTKLLPIIKEFYESQKINVVVKNIKNKSWVVDNKKNYDIFLDTSAYGVQMKNPIEIDPFPNFIINNEYDYDIVISPSSGRNSERSFKFNEIKNFIEKHEKNYKIVLLGVENNPNKFNNLGVTNCLNKTSISESIDIINSSKYVIAPSGFISFIGCLLNKNVFTKDNRLNIRKRYFHKEWSNKFISDINTLKL